MTDNEPTEEQVSTEFNYQSQHWAAESKNCVSVDKLIFSIGMKAGFKLGREAVQECSLELAEFLAESIFECGDDDRGATSRIEFKIPNPDHGGEYSAGGFNKGALVNFLRSKIEERTQPKPPEGEG